MKHTNIMQTNPSLPSNSKIHKLTAVILNSGLGHRMGVLTSEHPKCMTEISAKETILSRQLRLIADAGITEVVMTTGYFDSVLVQYCHSLDLPLHFTFVNNPRYAETNYIYSIYCAREYLRDTDVIMMHGDLVFEVGVFDAVVSSETSCMTVSSSLELPEKDFKAVVHDDYVEKIGIEFFNDAMAAQPLYKLCRDDWTVWLDRICAFCEVGKDKCYAENALNEVSKDCHIHALDVGDALCSEIDTPEDLNVVSEKLRGIENRTVYMCFSTDMLHSGHIAIIKKAQKLGKLIIGVLSDEAIASYKRYPLIPFEERKSIFESISGVYRVIEQKTLSYAENLRSLRPNFVVHGDDWQAGFQKPIRDEVVSVLSEYGGRLVEYPYSKNEKYEELEKQSRALLSMPDYRRGRLKKLIQMKGLVTAIEAHSGITGLIAEKTAVLQDGKTYQFDAMWVSSLCDSTAKGKPDIELVDMTSRFRTIDDIMRSPPSRLSLTATPAGLRSISSTRSKVLSAWAFLW